MTAAYLETVGHSGSSLGDVLCPGSVLSSYHKGRSLVPPYNSTLIISALPPSEAVESNGRGLKAPTVGAEYTLIP